MNKDEIIKSAINLLETTLGSMESRTADKVVAEVIRMLRAINDGQVRLG